MNKKTHTDKITRKDAIKKMAKIYCLNRRRYIYYIKPPKGTSPIRATRPI